MAFRQMPEKGSDAIFLREMAGFAAQRPMEPEVGEVAGAAHGERSPDRLVRRNGYRRRNWQTRAGTVDLRIPKLRRGSFFPCFPEPRRTAEKALVAVIQEADLHGASEAATFWTDLLRSLARRGLRGAKLVVADAHDRKVVAALVRGRLPRRPDLGAAETGISTTSADAACRSARVFEVFGTHCRASGIVGGQSQAHTTAGRRPRLRAAGRSTRLPAPAEPL
jgi:hypothetical protein